MKVLVGIVGMGMLVVAVLLGAIAQLIVELFPLLVVVAVAVMVTAVLRRRSGPQRPPLPAPPRFGAPVAAPPMGAPWVCPPPPAGWVMVPMWVGPAGPPSPRPYIDAEVIYDAGMSWR